MRAMTKRTAKGMVLQFNIGFVASILYDALPELIRRFRIIAPGAEANLLEMTTLEQVAALKDGRIDVGFGRLRFDDEAITRRVIRYGGYRADSRYRGEGIADRAGTGSFRRRRLYRACLGQTIGAR